MRSSTAAPVVDEVRDFFGFVTRYGGFWLLFFLVCRISFIGYHLGKLNGFSWSTIAGIFGYGLYIDLSTACYLTVIPYLTWIASSFAASGRSKWLIHLYSCAAILLTSVITVADLQLYQEYGAKINAQALSYLQHPKEAFASVSSSPLLLLISFAVVLALLGVSLYRSICRPLRFEGRGISWPIFLARVSIGLLFAGVIFLGIRGSVGVAPMNPSFAYFSRYQFANHAALNTCWNLMYDIKYYFRHQGTSYLYIPDREMQSRVDRILGKVIDTEPILTTDRPNIVVIILESWTADVIAELGAEKGITPGFDEFSKKGLLFTDFYASGYRSSFGIPAVLAGYPSNLEGSILNHPQKMERLPTLGGVLKQAGYASSFHYGGDDRFDDMNSFLIHSGFDRIVDREAFDKKDMNSKWGAQDHVLFHRVLEDLKGEKQPFFSAMFTLSSHEPFEVPVQTVYPGSDEADLFKNAVHYSDASLKAFLDQARQQPWYKNTLFVMVADHGHYLPMHRPNNYMPQRYHIPLLLYGEVLKPEFRGARRSTIGSQTDIAATILAQLHLPHDQFQWSNDLFNRRRNDYAFYNFHTGFALRTPQQTTVFDNVSKKVILEATPGRSPAANRESLRDTQAYMQYLYKIYARL